MLPMNLFSGSTFKAKAEGEETPASTNLVVNGDFEATDTLDAAIPQFTGGTMQLGTTKWWRGQINARVKVNGTTVAYKDTGVSLAVISDPGREQKDGNHVVKMIASDKCKPDLFQYLSVDGQKSSTSRLVAGKTYVATVWIKGKDIATKDGNALVARLRYIETAVDGKNGTAEVSYEMLGTSD